MWYRTRRAWNFVESGATSGIYKSTDGGENWSLITGPGSGFMSGTKTGRIGIAVYPKIPNIIYAVVDNNMPLKETEKTSDTLYKTSDFKGLSKDQFAALNNNKLDTFLKKSFVLRKYNAKMIKEMVATDKIKPTALYDYFDTDDGFQNNGIAGCEVYRSDNGGKSWVKTNKSPIGIFLPTDIILAKSMFLLSMKIKLSSPVCPCNFQTMVAKPGKILTREMYTAIIMRFG
jgi:hypothetical protein